MSSSGVILSVWVPSIHQPRIWACFVRGTTEQFHLLLDVVARFYVLELNAWCTSVGSFRIFYGCLLVVVKDNINALALGSFMEDLG